MKGIEVIGDGRAQNGGAQTRNGTEKKSHEMEQKCLAQQSNQNKLKRRKQYHERIESKNYVH